MGLKIIIHSNKLNKQNLRIKNKIKLNWIKIIQREKEEEEYRIQQEEKERLRKIREQEEKEKKKRIRR